MRFTTPLALLVALACMVTTASAQDKLDPGQLVRADGSVKATPSATSTATPTAAPVLFRGNTITITQNASQVITPVTGIACPTPPTNVYRLFDLGNFPLGANGLNVTSVDIGIEEVGTAGPTTLTLYRLAGPFVLANLTQVGTATVNVSAADNLTLRNVPITGTFARTDRLVVEWSLPRAGIFYGANAAAQTGPTYLQANGCNTPEPTDVATLGFPDAHWVVNVTGTTDPIAGPNVTATPGTVSFGRVAVGSTSASQTVTLTNNGTAATTISSITGSGAPFTVDLTGVDLTLDPGQSTTFTVTFSPTATGDATGTVTVTSNAPGSPLTINLTGTGFAPPPNDNFANATVIPAPSTVTGTNAEATLEPGEPVPTCQANESASVWWVYTPTANALLTVDLSASTFDTVLTLHNADQSQIACDDDGGTGLTSLLTDVPVTGGQPVYIRVSGFGGATGDISLALSVATGTALSVNPTAVDFGTVGVGGTTTQTVTLTNTGAEPVVVSSVTYTGNAQVTITQPATLTIAPGTSTTFTVTLTPTAVGNVMGTITVTSNAAGSPITIPVTATVSNLTTMAFCSGTLIDMPGGQPTTTTGPFGPYPATVAVSGIPADATVADVNVRLRTMNHTFPGDLDIFLAGPTGASTFLMSDVGGGTDLVDVTITLDDEAANPLPTTAITTGSYRPTNPGTAADAFPAPAPTPPAPGTPSLTVFDGLNANGTWNLWGVDDASGDFGTMAEYCVDITYSGMVANGNTPDATDALTVAPNPAAGAASVRLSVAESQAMTVAVYDVTGRQVAVLHDGAVAAGQPLALSLDATSLPAGVYVVRAQGETTRLTQRVTVVR